MKLRVSEKTSTSAQRVPKAPLARTRLYRVGVPILLIVLAVLMVSVVAAVIGLLLGFIPTPLK